MGVWVRGRDLAGRIEIGGKLPDEFGGKKTFPVIFKDECVESRQNFAQAGGHLRDLLLHWPADFFAIDSHDLLVSRDDPRFYNRPEIRVLEHEFGLGMTTPAETARLFELIAEGKIVDRATCDEMLAILALQQDRAMIPRRLPFERDRIFVASKTGWDEEKLPDRAGFRGDVRADAAYVKGPRGRYVIAILTRRVKDKSPGVDSEALVTGGRISRLVYDAFAGPRATPAR